MSRQSIREHIYTSAHWLGRTSTQVTCCGNGNPAPCGLCPLSFQLRSFQTLTLNPITYLTDLSFRTSTRAGSLTCFIPPSLRPFSYRFWTTSSTTSLPKTVFRIAMSSLSSMHPVNRVYTHTHPSSRKGSENIGIGCMTNMPQAVQI